MEGGWVHAVWIVGGEGLRERCVVVGGGREGWRVWKVGEVRDEVARYEGRFSMEEEVLRLRILDY